MTSFLLSNTPTIKWRHCALLGTDITNSLNAFTLTLPQILQVTHLILVLQPSSMGFAAVSHLIHNHANSSTQSTSNMDANPTNFFILQ